MRTGGEERDGKHEGSSRLSGERNRGEKGERQSVQGDTIGL